MDKDAGVDGMQKSLIQIMSPPNVSKHISLYIQHFCETT